jgi:hypothetical protein
MIYTFCAARSRAAGGPHQLLSHIQTRLPPAMGKTMAQAEVSDEQISDDPTSPGDYANVGPICA